MSRRPLSPYVLRICFSSVSCFSSFLLANEMIILQTPVVTVKVRVAHVLRKG